MQSKTLQKGMMMNRNTTVFAGMMMLASLGAVAQADDITITVENTMASDGFFFTPVWLSAHDGSFNTYDTGTMASDWSGLTELAEGGDTSLVSARFAAMNPGGADATLAAVAGMGDAPVFSPGESASMTLNVGDASVNRYFSFASMIVPSNDLFMGNDDPMAYELFDAMGNFNGPITIDIYGSQVNDAGTEVNDAFGGAAFSANGGMSVDEAVNIRAFFSDPNDDAYLDSFLGSMTGDGSTIGSTFSSDDLIARITIVPAPASLSLLGIGGLGLIRRRR